MKTKKQKQDPDECNLSKKGRTHLDWEEALCYDEKDVQEFIKRQKNFKLQCPPDKKLPFYKGVSFALKKFKENIIKDAGEKFK